MTALAAAKPRGPRSSLKLVEPQIILPAARKSGVGSSMAGGNPALGRVDKDFYATPPEPIVALLKRLSVEGRVWEPCCGDGAMARVLEAFGLEVVPTDLIDRGYGQTGSEWDLLQAKRLMADNVITNPPFNIAHKIIESVMELQPRMFAVLLKTTFWSAKNRIPLYRRYRPSWELQLTWRVDFRGLGRPTMECSWFVWERDYVGPMRHDLLERPVKSEVPLLAAA